MKRIVMVVLALSLTGLMPRLARAEQKIGYVDLQRALEESNQGKAAAAAIKAEFDKKQKELDQRQDELKKLKADLDRQSAVLKPDAIAAKQQELQQKVVTLQDTYMRLQRELQQRQADSTETIFKKMSIVIAQIAQAEGMTYVFERNSGLLYAPPSFDLTNELIRKFNAVGSK